MYRQNGVNNDDDDIDDDIDDDSLKETFWSDPDLPNAFLFFIIPRSFVRTS